MDKRRIYRGDGSAKLAWKNERYVNDAGVYFLTENESFLCNGSSSEIYEAPTDCINTKEIESNYRYKTVRKERTV